MTSAAPDLFAHPERISQTRRAVEIRRLAAYFDGRQYDGRPDWFTGLSRDGQVVPLRERKPCVIYPLPRAACNQATRFTFGEGRYPSVAVSATGDDEVDGSRAVSEEEAETLTRFIAAVTEGAGLKGALRTMLRHGLSQRTAIAAIGVRRGMFAVEMPRPQDCAVEFEGDDPSAPVARLVWCYAYDREVMRDGRIATEVHYFRRDWTADEVIAYVDAPAPAPGKDIEWVRDEARTVRHGFGFCPVVWARNLPEPTCQDVDGVSLYDGLEDELDALNFALSQRHRGIVYFGTPQAWETGVSEDEAPGEVARTSRPAKTSTAAPSAKDPYVKADAGRARKTAPDQIWSYQSADAKAGIMETTGQAFKVASDHVLDIRARILEAIDVVLLDPKEAAGRGEISGTALARLYAPLLALVDELRDCWWSGALQPVLSMILRINAALSGRGVLVPSAATVAALCGRFTVTVEGGQRLWAPPRMCPSWGAYFSPSADEVKATVEATSAAKDAGLIRAETAIRNVAPHFGETEVEELAEEAEQRKEEARAMMAAGVGDDADAAEDDEDDGAPPPKDGKPPARPERATPTTKPKPKGRPSASPLGG